MKTHAGVMEVSRSGDIGLGGLLFVVFVVLKLTDVIDWSWWWVTAPLWVPFLLVVAIGTFVVLFAGGRR